MDHLPATLLGEAHALLGETIRIRRDREAVKVLSSPLMASEAFAYIVQRVPGAMALLGVRPDGDGPGVSWS